MLCITIDELSTFLKSLSDLENNFFWSKDDFRKVESSLTVIQSVFFLPKILKLIISKM